MAVRGRRETDRRNIAAAGLDRDEMDLNPISFDEMRKGCYDAVARLADMDLNHVEASLCFPQMSTLLRSGVQRGQGQGPRSGLRPRVQRLDGGRSGCATDPARLIPLVMVPLWDGELAAAEIRRKRRAGRTMPSRSARNPYVLGFPSIHSGSGNRFLPGRVPN